MWGVRSFLWLWLLRSAVADEPADVKEIIVTLKPGKLGLTADWNSGRVTKIDGGGQASKAGIEVGMVMTQIDDKKYYEELLDRRLAGSQPFSMTLKVFPPPSTTTTTTTPEVPKFKYLKELDVDSFEWEVRKVANETDKPEYFPVVMFHVSWCKHCRAALPELEKAAEIVANAEQKGQLQGMQAAPRFFAIECDLEADKKALCEEYISTNYPCIKFF
jgi:thiol-disulfide isomerase/thioredoxin